MAELTGRCSTGRCSQWPVVVARDTRAVSAAYRGSIFCSFSMRCSRLQMSPVRTLLLFCVVYRHSVFAHTSAEHVQVLHWPAVMHGGDHLQFTLVAHNSAGERIWHGGDSYFVSLYGPGGTITPTAPIDNLDGTYSVSTRLMEAGTHQLCTVLHSTGWPDPHFHPTRCASTQRNPCNHSAAR